MKVKAILTALLLSLVALTSLAASNSPVGYWKTLDAKTGQVLGIVQIYPAGNGLEGKVATIMPVLGQKSTDICGKCKGAYHDKPILGMRIIWGMQQIAPDTWGRGKVLDTKSGNIYSGTMKVIDNGAHLQLHGYIGVSMFGRTETWIRASGK
jgi:uncharacterized protein (DUF2147 family)